jgi:hypothetical protein
MPARRREARLLSTVSPPMETREMPAQSSRIVRELDHRTCGGVDVRLLLSDYDGRVIVAVHDARTDDEFMVQVLPHDCATEVFAHPFAYAAARGIATSDIETALMMAAPFAA